MLERRGFLQAVGTAVALGALPPSPLEAKPFPGLAEFRRTMPVVNPPVSQAILEDREDRV